MIYTTFGSLLLIGGAAAFASTGSSYSGAEYENTCCDESAGCCHAGNAINSDGSYWYSLDATLDSKRDMVDQEGAKLVAKDGTPYEIINPNGLYASGFLIPSFADPTVPMVDSDGNTMELKVYLNISAGLGSLNIGGFSETGFGGYAGPTLSIRVGDSSAGYMDMSVSDLQAQYKTAYDEVTNSGADPLVMLVGGPLLSSEYVTQGTQHFGYWTDGYMVSSGASMAAVSDLAVTDVATTGLVPGLSIVTDELVCIGKAGQWLSADGRHASDSWARFTIEQTGLPVCFGKIMSYETGTVSVDGVALAFTDIF